MARRGLKNFQPIEFHPFSSKQKKVMSWWMPGSPHADKNGIVADGSIRSGKTFSMSLSFVLWAMHTFNAKNFGMAGKTIGALRRNVINDLRRMLQTEGFNVHDNRTDNIIVVSRGSGKNKVENYFYLFGGKDESSQDLIQGITLAGMYFDEVALMPESFVNQATGRLSVEGAKFWMNCNPESPFHYIKTDWVDRAEEIQALYVHFDMRDNLTLCPNRIKFYESMYTGVFYKRYIRGQWVQAEGLIYDNFGEDSIVKDENRRFTQYKISIDYGTQNATVFLLWGYCREDNTWYCIKEYYYSGREKGRQKTDEEYADELEDFIGNLFIRHIIVDPSASSFKATLRKRGLKVKDAVNDVLDGIRLTSSQITLGAVKIQENCKKTVEEISSYVWDEKSQKESPLKERDHTCDAVRYFVMDTFTKSVYKTKEVA